MKIPQILAEEPVGLVREPRLSAQAAGAGYEALGETGLALHRAGLAIAQVAREKQKQQQATEAMQLYTGFVDQLDQAEQDLQFGKTDTAGNLIEAPATHDTYRPLWQQRFDAIRRTVTSDDPEVQYATDRLMDRLRIERSEKARAHANTLFIQSEGAALQTGIDFWKKNLIEEPDPTVRDANQKLAENFILSKARVFGEEKVGEMVKAFRQDLAYNTIRRQIDANPFAIVPASQFADLSIDQQTRLQEYTRSQRELADKAQDRNMKRTSDEVEKMVQDAVEAKEWGRAGILLDVEGRRSMEPTRYEHWRERIRSRKDVGEDDPATVRRLNALVYPINADPQRAQEEIDRAVNAGRLSPDTERTLRAHTQAVATAKENKALAADGREHAQVEQQINNAIPTTGVFGATVVMAAQIREQALAELGRQSTYLGGSEKPQAWWERRRASYLARATEAGSVRLTELQQALLYKDITNLQIHRAELDKRDPTGRLYYEQLDLLRQSRELSAEIQRLRGKPTTEMKEAPTVNPLGRTAK